MNLRPGFALTHSPHGLRSQPGFSMLSHDSDAVKSSAQMSGRPIQRAYASV